MSNFFLKIVFFALTAIFLSSCASTFFGSNNFNTKEIYDGIAHVITLQTTFLNEETDLFMLEQKRKWFKWSESSFKKELEKKQSSRKKYTHVMMAAYASNTELDNFHKRRTLWRSYLHVDDKRYEGSISKTQLTPSEVKRLFPYYNSFASVYLVSFPIPSKITETALKVRFSLTSPHASYFHKIRP